MENFYIENRNTYLSPQEKRVLKYLIEGLDNEEIAKEMRVSIHTIKAHVSGIIRKLNARNRTQAACLALRNGLCGNLN